MNKLLKLFAVSVLMTGIAFAETMLTESLSVGGFVDMSYTDGDNGRDSTSGIDQIQFEFTFDNGGPVTAQVDIDYENGDDTNANIDEAYIIYNMNGGGAVTVGRFKTMLLQDASEPTGLYQYSNAYDFLNININQKLYDINLNQALYDIGDQGIKYTNGGFAISLVDNGDSKIGDGDNVTNDGDGDYAYEIGFTRQLSDKVTGFIGARITESDTMHFDGDIYNLHLTYVDGPWVIGGEYVNAEAPLSKLIGSDVKEFDVTGFSLFANYSYSEKNSVTVRYSDIDGDAIYLDDNNNDVKLDLDGKKYTFAHNSALSDDLALILEYSMQDTNLGDVDIFAVELLYAF